VNAQDSKAEIFDVFLCHSSEDKPAVREIALKLVKVGIKPWLDEDQIRPGTTWQAVLGQQIDHIKSAAIFAGDGGFGPWQDLEMQSFLNQFVSRKCAVIPVVLVTAKTDPKFPWPLEDFHRVDFRTDSQPLERLVWGIKGEKPAELSNLVPSEEPAAIQGAAKLRLIAGRDEQARSDNGMSEARLYPPLAERPDSVNTTQLNILRKRVSEYWVDGVLKNSLYNEVLISLDMRQVGNAVDAPWKYTVEVSDGMNFDPQDDRNVSAIYDAAGLLLILGEPGSGKTTTLLDLAQTLLDRARHDINERVAVVLNLSSWKNKQPLAEWISIELSEKYRVPRKIARFWLKNDYLLPLLDGLDEIETAVQPDCVAAINVFIEEFKPSGLVVCCRLNEYRWLPKRLKMNGGICIEPLTSEEVSKFLAAGGSKLAALREAVGTDPVIQELAQRPLMLSIMSIAFQKAASDELARQKRNLDDRRKQIFALYVEQMFQRKGTSLYSIPQEKIIALLTWLAEKMRGHSQTIFLLEEIQPSWLVTKSELLVYEIIVALSLPVILWLGFMLFLWVNFRPPGLLVGLFFAFISLTYNGIAFESGDNLIHITLVDNIIWTWKQFLNNTISGLILGLIVGLSIALVAGLIVGLNDGWFGGLIRAEFSVGRGAPRWLNHGFIWRIYEDRYSQSIPESRNQDVGTKLFGCICHFLVRLRTSLRIDRRAARRSNPRADLWAVHLADIRAARRIYARWLRRAETLFNTNDFLLKGIYATSFCQVPRSMCRSNSYKESRRWLHLHPSDASRLLC
jgi:hypothetical protein